MLFLHQIFLLIHIRCKVTRKKHHHRVQWKYFVLLPDPRIPVQLPRLAHY